MYTMLTTEKTSIVLFLIGKIKIQRDNIFYKKKVQILILYY